MNTLNEKNSMNIEERENYGQDDLYSQNNANRYKEKDLGSPLDNSITNDEDQNINKKFSNEEDFDDDNTLDRDNDINEEDPYPNDDEIDDADSEDDIDDDDDFQEDDLDDADDDRDADRPRNPSQF